MATAFDQACRVEADAMDDLVSFLKQQADNGQFVLITKGPLAVELQRTVGDGMVNRSGQILAVEFKVEQHNKHGNFFLETWSNRSRFNRGWLDHLKTDVLLYYFSDDARLYSIPFAKLKRWAFGSGAAPGNIYRYQERLQRKYNQLNDTWGRCVPIGVIRREVGLTEWRRGDCSGWLRVPSDENGAP